MEVPVNKTPSERKKTPTLLQMEMVECGAVSLGIILKYYGKHVALEELRQVCGVSRDGTSALEVLNAANQYGLEGEGLSVDLEAAMHIDTPYIAFWDFNHYIVVEGFSGDDVYINDPGTGPRKISLDEFNKGFTGVMIKLLPTEAFKPEGQPDSLLRKIIPKIENAKKVLAFVCVLGVFLFIPGIVIPGFSKLFIDNILVKQMNDWIRPLIFGMVITALLNACLVWIQHSHLLKLQMKLMISTTSTFFWHVLRLPVKFFDHRLAGDVAERVYANERIAELLSTNLTSSLIGLLTMVFYAIVLFVLVPPLAILGVGVTALNFMILFFISRMLKDKAYQLLQESGKLNAIEVNGIAAMETIRSSGIENNFFTQWSNCHAVTIGCQQRLALLKQLLVITPDLLQGLINVAVLVYGSFLIMDGSITVGTLVAFQALLLAFNGPLDTLLEMGDDLQRIKGDFYRLEDVLEHPKSKRKREGKSGLLKGNLEVNNVSFGYCQTKPEVLHNMSLTLQPGNVVAIVGRSGSGKSTLAKLICGLYEPWQGGIRLAEQPLQQLTQQQLSDSIALVNQDVFLFNGTLRENLTLWHTEVSDEILYQALDVVSLLHVINRRGGLAMEVLEGGSNFSGGECQRLEIARALISQPEILVLDEATASLDPVIENEIYTKLKQQQQTMIIIAHRLSTVRDSDEIIVLDKGYNVERGSHQQLLAHQGLYYQMHGAGDDV